MEYMDKIFLGCEGFGGWIETGFGTVRSMSYYETLRL